MFRKAVFVGISAAMVSTAIVAQTQNGTDEEAMALLDKAVAAVKADKTKALEMFNSEESQFRDRDLYVFCFNASDGITTAHPTNKGANLRAITDVNNFAFGEEMVRRATEGKISEIQYMWPRPGSHEPITKLTFFTKVSDQICAVGYFSSAGRCGGTGGGNVTTLTCAAGEYIAGLHVRGGAFVDQFSIACRRIPVSGAAGPLGEYKSAGPGGGTRSNSVQCTSGDAFSWISFSSGAYVDKAVAGGCASREGDRWGRAWYRLPIDIGGLGGYDCSVGCPYGEALYQVTVRHGGWIDSIRGDCRQ
jgi:hypothetical protein